MVIGGFVGGDSPALRHLSNRLEEIAGRLRSVETELTNGLAQTPWSGPDASRFDERWQTTYVRSMSDAARVLGEAAGEIRTDAQRQEQASGG